MRSPATATAHAGICSAFAHASASFAASVPTTIDDDATIFSVPPSVVAIGSAALSNATFDVAVLTATTPATGIAPTAVISEATVVAAGHTRLLCACGARPCAPGALAYRWRVACTAAAAAHCDRGRHCGCEGAQGDL